VGLLLPIVPRNRVVTPDVVTEALGEVDRPFVTTGDVADKLGVTKQAVRNHHEELNQASGLESGKVGRQRVYWLADDSVPEQVTQTESEPRTPEPPEREPEPQTGDDDESYFWRLITQRIRSVERHRHLITVLSLAIPGLMTAVAVGMLFQAFGLAPLFVAGVAVLIPVQFTMMVVSHAAMLYILSTRSQTDTSPIQNQQRVDQ